MTVAEDREALADMLVRCGIERGVLGRIDADNVARILQPVVDAIARRRAAAQFASLLAVSPQLFGANGELRGYIVSLPLLSTIGIDADAVSRTLDPQ